MRKRITVCITLLLLLAAFIFTASAAASPEEAPAETAETAAETGRPMGDADLDGAVTAGDARAILRAEVSLEPLGAEALPYADVDLDGTLSAADARLALRLAVNLEGSPAFHTLTAQIQKQAACAETGTLTYECAVCGLTGTLTVPANGHDYGEETVVPATCTKAGSTTRVCNTCGNKEIIPLRLAPHKWQDGAKIQCAVCGAKAPGWASTAGGTYYCVGGEKQRSWCEIGGAYYFLDRSTGKLAVNTTVDGLSVGPDGRAATDAYTTEKIRTFIKAKEIVRSITLPTDSVAEKKYKAFRWVMKWPYKQYRQVGLAMYEPGFEMLFANDIFDHHNGCCGSTSYAFAFLAVECGCKAVYVSDDGVDRGGHAWVVMEGNNRVYDVIFAEAKGFNANYDHEVSDYRRRPPRKTYVGG